MQWQKISHATLSWQKSKKELVAIQGKILYAFHEVIKMNFGLKLQELRKAKGLSQEALADQLNISRPAVS